MEENISKLKRIGQRGPDRKPRAVNPKSLSNLKQFQKPVSEANLSVNSGVNLGTNWNKLGIITVFVITVGLLIWKFYKKDQNRDEN